MHARLVGFVTTMVSPMYPCQFLVQMARYVIPALVLLKWSTALQVITALLKLRLLKCTLISVGQDFIATSGLEHQQKLDLLAQDHTFVLLVQA